MSSKGENENNSKGQMGCGIDGGVPWFVWNPQILSESGILGTDVSFPMLDICSWNRVNY